MSKYLSADDFLKGIIGEEEDFEIEGVGTIRIRPVGMGEAMRISSVALTDAERFVQLLSRAIVSPQLDETQVQALYGATADKLRPILDRISAMTGKAEDADPLAGGGS